MNPSDIYADLVRRSELSEDKFQIEVLKKLDLISSNLNTKSWKWFRSKPLKGLYIYGEVGRGKTKLMDIFFLSIDSDKKVRLHFHRFMKKLHDELKEASGTVDPILKIARNMANEARIFCFDEFYVEDIGDAMLLARFLNRAFEAGITLVATSNIRPENLYINGLQRNRFLPAIDAIKNHCEIFELTSKQDYRLRTLTKMPMYLVSKDSWILEDSFNSLLGEENADDKPISILGRSLKPKKKSSGIIWFDFIELCLGPRSTKDYIELTKEFHTILLSNIPALIDQNKDGTRRFIALIDECYERNVNVILSSKYLLKNLYKGTQLNSIFQRTLSRLTEMQSKEFLSKPHMP
tara:strand:+ start:3640 stop:4689 length:1050 start_codon:yes stop_codon:yes gene_type:complete